jgi:capsule biosynthesis phosphatase
MKNNKIIIDLDGTITIDDPSLDYISKEANEEIIKAIKSAKNKQFDILIYTARNMRTYKGDIDKIHNNTKPIALKWLKKNNVLFDHIQFGKPWAGNSGFYVDDKALHLEEFSFKFMSYFSNKSVDIVVSFFNEGKNVYSSHNNIVKAQRLINIKNFIYVNNGSTDDTLNFLKVLSKRDSRIKVIDNQNSKGYGNGYKVALQNTSADIIISNHGDNQFDIYLFLLTHRKFFCEYNPNKEIVIFPQRISRPKQDAFSSFMLQKIISCLLMTKVGDFNGQPKIFSKKFIPNDLQRAPDDFTFDLWLYIKLKKYKIEKLHTYQSEREYSISSWNRGIKDKFNLFIKYIIYTLRRKK